MRFGLYQPFTLTVRLGLLCIWVVIVVGVIAVGSRSPQPNHPVGLLLLGLGLAIPGILALLARLSPAGWQRLIDPEHDAQRAKVQCNWLMALGLIGFVMMWSALDHLL